jgi:hypothetical protein
MSTTTEEQTLRREIGWYGSFAMGYADVGADIYVAIGLVALFAAGVQANGARPAQSMTYDSPGRSVTSRSGRGT